MKIVRALVRVSNAHRRFHGNPNSLSTPLLSLCSSKENIISQSKWSSFLKSFDDTPIGHSRIIGAEYKFSSRFCTKAATPNNGVLEPKGVPTSVPVTVAHHLFLSGYRYLDVRTREEFKAGHAPGAINIPYWHKYGDDTTKNAEFLEQVSSQFGKDDKIIIGCKSGRRSMMAASDLLAAGFDGVKDVAGGYDDWTKNGLPTEL